MIQLAARRFFINKKLNQIERESTFSWAVGKRTNVKTVVHRLCEDGFWDRTQAVFG